MEIVRTPDGHATHFRDSVVLKDGDAVLVARQAWMYQSRGVAVAQDSVCITSPEARVWADSAVYQTGGKLAELCGNVRVEQESLDITAPRLIYSTREKLVRAEDGVALESRQRNYRLEGRRGQYDLDRSEGVVDSAPVLSWVRGSDTMRVTGTRMGWFERESRATASGEVRVSSGKSELTCDSAVFFANADSGIAWGEPKASDSSGSATGDTMLFYVDDGALEQVAVRGNASGQYLTDDGDEVVVEGESIRLWVADGDIDWIEVVGMTDGRLVRHAGAPR
jgi:lipopolysaccharide export system protein LptA